MLSKTTLNDLFCEQSSLDWAFPGCRTSRVAARSKPVTEAKGSETTPLSSFFRFFSVAVTQLMLHFPAFCCFVSIACLRGKTPSFHQSIKITRVAGIDLLWTRGFGKMIYCCCWSGSTHVRLWLHRMRHSHRHVACGLGWVAEVQACLPRAVYSNNAKHKVESINWRRESSDHNSLLSWSSGWIRSALKTDWENLHIAW